VRNAFPSPERTIVVRGVLYALRRISIRHKPVDDAPVKA
jgi:hypothetical protein